MILSETEILEILERNITIPAQSDEWAVEIIAALPEDTSVAAHAIAEKMKRRVVWDGVGYWHADGHLLEWEGAGLGSIIFASTKGPRAHVYVVLEEKQEA